MRAREGNPVGKGTSSAPTTVDQHSPTRPRFRTGDQLAAALSRLSGLAVEVHLTDNRRTMFSWRRNEGGLDLRCHHMFLDAPDSVLVAIVEFVQYRPRWAREHISLFIRANGDKVRKAPTAPRRRPLGTPRGRYFDLEAIARKVNDVMLNGAFEGTVIWGRRPPRRRRSSIRLGSYQHSSRLIRIHPALDRPDVPLYVLEWLIYHEMLHQIVPSRREGGRRVVHGPEFKRLEKRFPYYERAVAWEKANLDKLLRS